VSIKLWSPLTGRAMTNNPTLFELTANGVRGYFIPDDDNSVKRNHRLSHGNKTRMFYATNEILEKKRLIGSRARNAEREETLAFVASVKYFSIVIRKHDVNQASPAR
jgi:hypothetical protein